MQLIIMPDGSVKTIYDEAFPLTELGSVSIQRASHVEPDESGKWVADLSPVNGPALGPFAKRSDALASEVAWLEANWLTSNI